MITPNDIETKVFSYSVRGYNKREVDEFLDQIMIDYQALLDQNAKMLERVHVLQKQVSDSKDPANMTRDAKRLMNDISASAEQKAEIIIKNAQHDAENIVRNAKNSTSQADEDAERLRRKVEKFKLRYKQLLEEELGRLDDSSEDLLDDLRKDFFPGYIYGKAENAEFTKVAGSAEVDDMIADLPDVEPEDEAAAHEYSEALAHEEAEAEAEAEEEPAEEAEDLETEPEEEAPADFEEEAEAESEPAEEAEIEPDEEPEAEAGEKAEGEEETDEAEETEEGQGTLSEEELSYSDYQEEPEEAAEEPVEAEAEAESEEEPEEEAPEEAAEPETQEEDEEAEEEEQKEDDPLLEKAREANVDVDDLPGFRSSADDVKEIKKNASRETIDITSGIEEAEAEQTESGAAQAAEKAKELKDTAAKFVNGLFSKKD